MRSFNQEIYAGNAHTMEIFSLAEHNALLGSADELAFHFFIDLITGASPLFTAKLYSSNNDVDFEEHTTLLSAVTIGADPATRTGTAVQTSKIFGNFLRVGFFTGSNTLHVRIVASGRIF